MIRTSDITRRVAGAALCLGLTSGLGGCRHRVVLAPLPPALAPVELVDVPPLENPPLLEAPVIKLPAVPIAAAAARPKPERRRSRGVAVAPPAPAPEPTAAPPVAAPPAEANAIGALTAGGEANPQTKQDATDLLASIEKRLNALPAQMNDEGKAQVNKVKNFWRDAQAALQSGDAEGAKTLATKAKLLLDDMEK